MKHWQRQAFAATAALLATVCTFAATPMLRDPALPEALRHTRPALASEGAALQAQVDAKLRSRFEAADVSGQGSISRTQAEAAGLGFVARHFDAIDAAGHGSVSWAQVRAYIADRAAAR
ncbi:EF-hand domain-containing protein [Ideonella sp.]|uniref:EF-hand domain-containing protein n=1 Tax=Ideonella sp. TaxID=1929293 RepID=UPI0035B1DEC3